VNVALLILVPYFSCNHPNLNPSPAKRKEIFGEKPGFGYILGKLRNKEGNFMEAGEIIAFVVMALIAGTAAATLLGNRKGAKGGWLRNTIIGVIGALVGQFLFDLLNLELPEILQGTITLAGIIVAFLGALLVMVVAGFVRR
jgi:uncharacterized membrane protein YeaQ/YmgE (transglycosylase-associated protein family)